MPQSPPTPRQGRRPELLGIGGLVLVVAAVTTIKYHDELAQLRTDYRERRQLEAKLVAERVDGTFRQLYQGLRTMTLLPGVRTIGRHGEGFAPDSRAAMQQIYNNTYENVQLSEVYILPRTLDPERIDPHTGKGEEPILTFDEFIVGGGETAAGADHHAHDDELPEDEADEYRQYKAQLEHLALHHPTDRTFQGIDVPAIASAQIVTCDNTEWTAEHRARGDDEPRSGIALTLPRYDLNGDFAGGVSGIVRTRVLARLLPPGTTALVAPRRGFRAIQNPSRTWLDSVPHFTAGVANPELIFSAVLDLHVVDTVPWQLWVACPDDEFWRLPEVGKTRLLWWLAIAATLLLGLAAAWIAQQARSRRRKLESEVAITTAELAARNQRMRLILDTAEQGFLMVGVDGTLAAEASLAITRWFGPVGAGMRLRDYLYAGDPRGADLFDCSFEQLVGGMLPFEVAADQMPRRLERDGRSFGLGYQPVQHDGKLERLLVVVSDVTAAAEAERNEAERRELHEVMQLLFSNRTAFQRFVGECDDLLAELPEVADVALQRRLLHTLKGNTAIHGLARFADRCHRLEDQSAATGRLLAGADFAGLQQDWARLHTRLEDFLDADSHLRIDPSHYRLLLERIRMHAPHEQLLQELQAWQLEPLASHLQPLALQAERLAQSLGKQVRVDIDDRCVRVPPGALPQVWPVLVHLVRNALDHGIESPDERLAAGKPATGTLSLTSDLVDESLELVIEDDGRGIAWSQIAAKAAARGLPHADHADLVEALFTDGMSTAATVTALSGRGVGMSAVRAACRACSGQLQVVSEPGRGTRWVLQFPRRVVPGLLQVCFVTRPKSADAVART